MQMPEMDGLELARAIGADAGAWRHAAADAHVLGPDRRREAARAAGIAAYLTKPVRPTRLRDG